MHASNCRRIRRKRKRRSGRASRDPFAFKEVWFGNTTELSPKALDKLLQAPKGVIAFLSAEAHRPLEALGKAAGAGRREVEAKMERPWRFCVRKNAGDEVGRKPPNLQKDWYEV